MESELNTIYCKSDSVVAREVAGELIIIPMMAGIGDMENEIYALDEISQEIWNLIDGKKKLAEIIDNLKSLYNAPPGVIRDDVLGLINEISKRGFITAVVSQ